MTMVPHFFSTRFADHEQPPSHINWEALWLLIVAPVAFWGLVVAFVVAGIMGWL